MINLNFVMNLKESGNLINFLREFNVLKRIIYCSGCNNPLKTVKYKRNIDEEAFRCYKTGCPHHKKYISMRSNSFFDHIKLPLWESTVVLYNLFSKKTYSDIKTVSLKIKKIGKNIMILLLITNRF